MTIEVNLTAEEFNRFSIFDTFRRRKMYRSPLIFASILSVCAVICFVMRHVEGAVMLGSVLLLVGLGMPLSYFTAFFFSLKKQNKVLGLPKTVYTLCLTEKANGIGIQNDREQADYKWKNVHHAYRCKTATYLFMTPAQGFILPHTCVEGGGDALWQLLEKTLSDKQRTLLHK